MDKARILGVLNANKQALQVAKFEVDVQGARQLTALMTANESLIQELSKDDGDDSDADKQSS